MLAIEERFKYVGTAEKYLDAAKAAMNFINTRKRTDEEGIYWTLADAAAGKPSYYDEICMYAGASGIICFLLSLYEDTQDAAYLDEAKEAGCYLEYRWRKRRELKRNFSPYAFSTGWGGASFALLQMYLVTKDEHYRRAGRGDSRPGGSGCDPGQRRRGLLLVHISGHRRNRGNHSRYLKCG